MYTYLTTFFGLQESLLRRIRRKGRVVLRIFWKCLYSLRLLSNDKNEKKNLFTRWICLTESTSIGLYSYVYFYYKILSNRHKNKSLWSNVIIQHKEYKESRFFVYFLFYISYLLLVNCRSCNYLTHDKHYKTPSQ